MPHEDGRGPGQEGLGRHVGGPRIWYFQSVAVLTKVQLFTVFVIRFINQIHLNFSVKSRSAVAELVAEK